MASNDGSLLRAVQELDDLPPQGQGDRQLEPAEELATRLPSQDPTPKFEGDEIQEHRAQSPISRRRQPAEEHPSPGVTSPAAASSDQVDRTAAAVPPGAALQDTEKRAALAAMLMMEKRLKNFTPAEDFARLREHVEQGFDSIGAQIRAS